MKGASMNTVVLRMRDAEALKANPKFILGLNLSRLYNALNANMRHYQRIGTDNPADKRDRIERVFYHAAIVSECLTTLKKNYTSLEDLPCWKSDQNQVQYVKRQILTPDPFAETVLKTIRDKIAYHYDISVISDIIEQYPLHDGIRFGEVESESGIDLCFPLLDEMAIHYVIKRYAPEKPEAEVYDSIMESLVDNSNNLLWTLKELITDLIAKHMEWQTLP
jgi:hypothetical protein